MGPAPSAGDSVSPLERKHINTFCCLTVGCLVDGDRGSVSSPQPQMGRMYPMQSHPQQVPPPQPEQVGCSCVFASHFVSLNVCAATTGA
jgi:hypothetical protein